MHIRQARPEDLPAIAALEARGFPPAEAASPESFAARFAVFPHCFFVAEDDGVIVGHINGCMTDFDTCRDELYHDAGLHREEAPHQAVFGLVVDPQRRHQGIGAALVRHFLEAARQRGIPVCNVPAYGTQEVAQYAMALLLEICGSQHGQACWYDMRCPL